MVQTLWNRSGELPLEEVRGLSVQFSILRALVVVSSFLIFTVVPAAAHQSSLSYATVERAPGGKTLLYEIRLSAGDLYEALALGEDRVAMDQEILQGAKRLQDYVFSKVSLRPAQPSCEFIAVDVKLVEDGQRFAKLAGQLQCPKPILRLQVVYELFFDLDPRHEGLLRVGNSLYQLRTDTRRVTLVFADLSGSAPTGFILSGWQHVLYGPDHIAFLLALLLVVGYRQDEKGWVALGAWAALRKTAGIVTAFTLAHSLTLIAASLGWVSLPGRLVESAIAVSILYVAFENVAAAEPKHRFALTFGFGLVHGLGFAAMLRPLLPPDDALLPLLFFNLGVELGQLSIVALALPVALLLIRCLGVSRYRRLVVTGAAIALAAVALLWLAERNLQVELIWG